MRCLSRVRRALALPTLLRFEQQVPLDANSGRLAQGEETAVETIPLSGFPHVADTVNANGIEVTIVFRV